MTRQQILASGLVIFGAAGLLASTLPAGSRPHAPAPGYAMAMQVGGTDPDVAIRTAGGALDCRRVYALAGLTIGQDSRRNGTTVALGN